MKIYDFTDLFDFAWGDRENKTANITDLPEGDREFGVRFTVPMNSEEDVRMGIPMMAFVMNKNVELELTLNGEILYKDNRDFSFFANLDGVDPKPLKVRDDTHGGQEYEVDRETHLTPGETYIYIQRDNHTSNQPAVTYQSSQYDEDAEYYGGTLHTLDGVDGIWFPLP